MAHVFRDIQCSMDVGRMAELGKFDKECVVYGCAYMQNHKSYYRVSEHAETLYQFFEKSCMQQIFPTAMTEYSETLKSTMDTKENFNIRTEWKLGKILSERYSDEFLYLLDQLGKMPASNGAVEYLEQWQNALDGTFHKEYLQIFNSMLVSSVQEKKLTLQEYQKFKMWSEKIEKQLENDIVVKDIYNRTLYGFGYRKNSQNYFLYDAQYEVTYKQREDYQSQGLIVTPIYSKTYWFRNFGEFFDIKQKYLCILKHLLTPCLETMEKIHKKPSFIEAEVFYKTFSVLTNMSQEERLSMKKYEHLWNCTK